MSDQIVTIAKSLPCPYCGASPGQTCRTSGGTPIGSQNHPRVHNRRITAALVKQMEGFGRG